MNIQFPLFFIMGNSRAEYQRLRHNILRREKRIAESGLSRFLPKIVLPESNEIKNKDISRYLKRAQRLDSVVRVSVAKSKKKAEREYKREYRAIKKLDQDEQNYIKGIKKWLKRHSSSPNLITSKNYKKWIGYIEYRRAIESSNDKYKFDKYIADVEELLTDEEEKIDFDEVLADYMNYIKEQITFIEESKSAFDAKTGVYSSDDIARRYFEKRKKKA